MVHIQCHVRCIVDREKKMSTITIDNKEYKLEDMSERAKGLAIHCRDLQEKILTKPGHTLNIAMIYKLKLSTHKNI